MISIQGRNSRGRNSGGQDGYARGWKLLLKNDEEGLQTSKKGKGSAHSSLESTSQRPRFFGGKEKKIFVGGKRLMRDRARQCEGANNERDESGSSGKESFWVF